MFYVNLLRVVFKRDFKEMLKEISFCKGICEIIFLIEFWKKIILYLERDSLFMERIGRGI